MNTSHSNADELAGLILLVIHLALFIVQTVIRLVLELIYWTLYIAMVLGGILLATWVISVILDWTRMMMA